ncbi:sigma-70 family RNA polymerase sigma factor [Shimazuella sp. AN120528]|uniref:sigma-70 family RNA polymerase sigma factor n=1 Tax=Shimazuella soli TaxID=1892854 RepID=UPI001F0FAED2|nr:sigma-70 family RNA polymerase sigma factor [Shimazuella soli]MCH5585515.1 sigma-70 family RNA polymerase sigma factor [Shimazuella soli]
MEMEQLIRKAQKGDWESFSQVVFSAKDQAYRIAYCYLYNENDSMDAVCDAMEKAYRKIKSLREPQFFSTWFIRIVINECKTQLKKKKNARFHTEVQAVIGQNPEEIVDLKLALQSLSPSERVIVQMKFFLGYTFQEIAEAIEIPEGTVKTKLYQTLKLLKSKLALQEV